MRNAILNLKLSELSFFFAGLLILASLPWLHGAGFYVWLFAKVLYFMGIGFFFIKK